MYRKLTIFTPAQIIEHGIPLSIDGTNVEQCDAAYGLHAALGAAAEESIMGEILAAIRAGVPCGTFPAHNLFWMVQP